MTRSRKTVKALWNALLIVLAAASAVLAMGDAKKAPDIRIENASALSSPSMLGVASVFMNIVNTGGGDVLLSAKTDVEGTIAELHDMKDGKMVKVERISVPSRGVVELSPGTLHIMIFGLPKNREQGKKIRLTLVFERSGELALTVAIESNRAHQMGHGHH